MPRRDGTGPMGMGPMTGWGTGLCSDVPAGNYGMKRKPWGRALARGYGRGMGYGFRSLNNQAPMAPQDEISFLKNQANYIKNEMDSINARIKELESGT